ncbi:MAG: hypothetical protein FWF24_05455 [Alphaproteobacteria bacterium]|nr:hypothetical protein [Alphaproteobacteria bacterium]
MKRFIWLSLVLCALSGCARLSSFWHSVWDEPQRPFVVGSTMPETERWCYRSLGRIECYKEIQDFPPDTLFTVDPPSRQPMSRQAYEEELAKKARQPEKR